MKPILAWILWVLVAAAVYFAIFMVVIVGLAAAAGHDEVVRPLASATAVGTAAPFFLSIHFMRKQRFALGVAAHLAALPLVYGLYQMLS